MLKNSELKHKIIQELLEKKFDQVGELKMLDLSMLEVYSQNPVWGSSSWGCGISSCPTGAFPGPTVYCPVNPGFTASTSFYCS